MNNSPSTSSTFHIVNHVKDWQQHNAQERRDKLSSNLDQAAERDLEKAAERFIPSSQLLNAINASLAARVPLLLTGEPGTGKTQVAWYLKRFFEIPLYAYQVHSNSQANDLRYDFDAVAYLRDAYLGQQAEPSQENVQKTAQETPTTQDPRSNPRYLKKATLWKAYENKGECILLIDEIDKAPRDFPNDLLQEIDQQRFEHPFQQGEYIERPANNAPPLTIITSNGERRLPDAFLRRCMVHHISLNKELLRDILNAWKIQFPNLNEETREIALQHFETIREISRLSKRPGTAELLLWLSVLSAQDIKASALNVETQKLPALECLIKDHDDYQYL